MLTSGRPYSSLLLVHNFVLPADVAFEFVNTLLNLILPCLDSGKVINIDFGRSVLDIFTGTGEILTWGFAKEVAQVETLVRHSYVLCLTKP